MAQLQLRETLKRQIIIDRQLSSSGGASSPVVPPARTVPNGADIEPKYDATSGLGRLRHVRLSLSF